MDKLNPNSIQNFSEKYTGKYVISDKLDGISALLTFDQNKTVKMYTRGDGVHGQDISHIIQYIGDYKAPVSYKWENKKIVLRGELIMKKETFEKLGGSNARNVVAGIINKKKAEESFLKDIDFIVYNVIEPNIKPSEC